MAATLTSTRRPLAAGNLTKNGLPFLHNFGTFNTFLGLHAGNFSLSGGFDNTGIGAEALKVITTGNQNTAIGASALSANTSGAGNAGVGSLALFSNTTGIENTAIGLASLFANTEGIANVAIGFGALHSVTSGDNNVGVGLAAGANNDSGSNNIYVGTDVHGVAGESNTMYLGNVGTQTKTVIAGVRGTTVSGGEMVVVDASGRFGSAPLGAPATDTVSSAQVIDDSLTAADLGPASVGASELAPASVDASKVAFNYAGSASIGGAASNAELLDGLDATAFATVVHGHDVTQVTGAARLTAPNTFVSTQGINNGNLDLDPSSADAGNLTKDGLPFLHNFRSRNTFLGIDAGNFSMVESANDNTGIGTEVLKANTTGNGNAAVGNLALFSNTTGAGQHRHGLCHAVCQHRGNCQRGARLRRVAGCHLRQLQRRDRPRRRRQQ